uniref:(northern house mosquito) hypothetical protein n=1 Tax=Culex pipiens TaxID=7175 RepID=A0A8D8AJ40_CULPI
MCDCRFLSKLGTLQYSEHVSNVLERCPTLRSLLSGFPHYTPVRVSHQRSHRRRLPGRSSPGQGTPNGYPGSPQLHLCLLHSAADLHACRSARAEPNSSHHPDDHSRGDGIVCMGRVRRKPAGYVTQECRSPDGSCGDIWDRSGYRVAGCDRESNGEQFGGGLERGVLRNSRTLPVGMCCVLVHGIWRVAAVVG